ncbi:hypothetical protein XAP6164_3580006 [Xanthomonas phaseoli pv. phaseoli]|nr:hypothetical protein XAP6164_3580006 [Xanthomonas phaseoli pv. phaseoli]
MAIPGSAANGTRDACVGALRQRAQHRHRFCRDCAGPGSCGRIDTGPASEIVHRARSARMARATGERRPDRGGR